MDRFRKTFEACAKQNRAALAIFVACGDGGMDFTKSLVARICSAGADVVELGVPFSDPMADGATIQNADVRALADGADILKIIETARQLRAEGVDKLFVLFSYYNPIFKVGVEKIARLSAEAGIDSWLVVDAPLEESGEIRRVIGKYGVKFTPLAAPTTSEERIRRISKSGGGFLYYVTVAGVTGARNSLPEGVVARLARVKEASVLPVAAGFGISNPEMAHAAALNADMVVVGSRFIDMVYAKLSEGGREAALSEAESFVKAIRGGLAR